MVDLVVLPLVSERSELLRNPCDDDRTYSGNERTTIEGMVSREKWQWRKAQSYQSSKPVKTD